MQQQAWIYQQKPVAGRKLLLLHETELVLSLPLIYRLIHPEAVNLRVDWFCELDDRQSAYVNLVTHINALLRLRKKAESLDAELVRVNTILNHYFSDLGWRNVRKELSQMKKRQKKSHIELSNDLIVRLRHYMAVEKLDSFDQALDTLLSEHESVNLKVHCDLSV